MLFSKRSVFLIVVIVFFLIFLLVKNVYSLTLVNECIDLNTPNEIYQLANNVNGSKCFNVSANNIVLDCLGYNINYSSSAEKDGFGINITGFNNTQIQNCNITTESFNLSGDGIYGIIVQSAYGINITNNSIDSSNRQYTPIYPLMLSNSHNNTITNNTIILGGIYSVGIYLSDSDNNTIEQNFLKSFNVVPIEIENSMYKALIFMSNSKNNTLRNNQLNTTHFIPIRIQATIPSQSNHSIDNTNLAWGLPINYTHNVNNYYLEGINFSKYGQTIFAGCSEITINYSNFSSGLYLFNTRNSFILNNNFTVVNGSSIYLDRSNNNTISNVSILNNIWDGIVFDKSDYNTIINSKIETTTNADVNNIGVLFYHLSSSNLIKNTNITNNIGIYAFSLTFGNRHNKIENTSIVVKRNAGKTVIAFGLTYNNTFSNSTLQCSGNGCSVLYVGYNLDSPIINQTYLANNISLFNTVLDSKNNGNDTFIYNAMGSINYTNCTMNYSKIRFLNTAQNFTININQYLTTTIYDPFTNSFLNLANISAYNRTDILVKNGTTNVNGNLTFVLQEVMMNASGSFYHTNYTVNASYGTYNSLGRSINLTNETFILLNITTNIAPYFYNITFWDNVTDIMFDLGRKFNGSATIGELDSGQKLNISFFWYEEDTIIISNITNGGNMSNVTNGDNGTLYHNTWNLTSGNYKIGYNYSLGVYVCDGGACNQSNSTKLFINNTIPISPPSGGSSPSSEQTAPVVEPIIPTVPTVPVVPESPIDNIIDTVVNPFQQDPINIIDSVISNDNNQLMTNIVTQSGMQSTLKLVLEDVGLTKLKPKLIISFKNPEIKGLITRFHLFSFEEIVLILIMLVLISFLITAGNYVRLNIRQ